MLRPHSRGRSALQVAVLSAPGLWLLGAGWAHRWITDDGFIYLRVVRQLRAGNGPVFNDGERVEAFTGVLWVAILAVADAVTPLRLEWLAVLLGLAAAVAGVGLAIAGAVRLHAQPAGTLHLPFGAVAFVAILPVWVYATSGLETGITFGWLGGSLWLLARWARAPRDPIGAPSAAFLGLGWLVRPELALFSAAFLFVLVTSEWRSEGPRRGFRTVAAMVALPAAYQLFRMAYYGSVVANTAIAKEGARINWDRGWRYFTDFSTPYWLWFVGLVVLVGGYLPLLATTIGGPSRRPLAVAVVFPVAGILDAMYVVAVGGDYLHARLFLPALFAITAPVAAVPAVRRNAAAILLVPWVFAAVATLRPVQWTEGWLANLFVLQRDFGEVTVDDHEWGTGDARRAWYAGPAVYYTTGLFTVARADIPVAPEVELPLGAFHAVGLAPYALGTGFTVIDLLGITDTFTAHLERLPPSMGDGLAGHEKLLPPAWLVARVTSPGTRLDAADFSSEDNPFLPPDAGREYWEDVAWARAALRCPGIIDLERAAEEPLGFRRVVDNLRRSLTNARLRIPPDPEDAYRTFCGDGVPDEVAAIRARG